MTLQDLNERVRLRVRPSPGDDPRQHASPAPETTLASMASPELGQTPGASGHGWWLRSSDRPVPPWAPDPQGDKLHQASWEPAPHSPILHSTSRQGPSTARQPEQNVRDWSLLYPALLDVLWSLCARRPPRAHPGTKSITLHLPRLLFPCRLPPQMPEDNRPSDTATSCSLASSWWPHPDSLGAPYPGPFQGTA